MRTTKLTDAQANQEAVDSGVKNHRGWTWKAAFDEAKRFGYTGLRAALFADAATGNCKWQRRAQTQKLATAA